MQQVNRLRKVASVPREQDEQISELVSRNWAAIQGYIYQKIGCQDESKDLTQEVFYRFTRKNETSKFLFPKALLYKIAGNLLLDRLRRRQVRDADQHISFEDKILSRTEDPARIVDARQELEILEEVIKRLPKRCREVFVLSRFSNMTNRNIADHLGISLGVVEKQISKALLRCRKELEGRNYE